MGEIEHSIKYIKNHLNQEEPYGMNLICHFEDEDYEIKLVQLFLQYGVSIIEASAFMQITPALVLYRLNGLTRKNDKSAIKNRILAKVSRPEVAQAFLSPAPEKIVNLLLQRQLITNGQAELAKALPMCDDLIVEADSGGHTDMGAACTIFPSIKAIKIEMEKHYGYQNNICVGLSGGIGTPEAAGAAFILGADFIETGSINQCTVEAATSNETKKILEKVNVQDTAYVPAADMFELGARVQVAKKGLLFPTRANKLYETYKRYNSLDGIDKKTRDIIESKYFKRSFDDVWEETKNYFNSVDPKQIEKANENQKHKMALVFRWYLNWSTKIAISGDNDNIHNFQIPCGSSLGSFNQWIKDTPLEKWEKRHVDVIGVKLMADTADILNKRMKAFNFNA